VETSNLVINVALVRQERQHSVFDATKNTAEKIHPDDILPFSYGKPAKSTEKKIKCNSRHLVRNNLKTFTLSGYGHTVFW
jgi:hypothetical protein